MPTVNEIKKANGKRKKRLPRYPVRSLYEKCKAALPAGMDMKTWREVTNTLNEEMVSDLIDGKLIKLPHDMGSISLRRKPRSVRFDENGKPKINTPIDWGATTKLWSEDENALRNKTLIHFDSSNIYAFVWSKENITYLYANRIEFKPIRTANLRLRDRLKDGEIDCLAFYKSL